MVKTYYTKDGEEQLSKNFKKREFRCKCGKCTEFLVDDVLIEHLQKIRDHFGASITVNSGYRCKTHNAKVGGSSSSHHMRGKAADIRVKGVKPIEVAKYAESIGVQRIGLYESAAEGEFVHIGSDSRKKFWRDHAGTPVDTFGGTMVSINMPILMKGIKSDTVKSFQNLLIAAGYSCGSKGADGSFGATTKKTVIKYQTEKGLEVTGTATAETWKSLLGV